MISLIVGCDNNWVIGNGPDMPWHLPADFEYFKKMTIGHPIIMGRTTCESIGKALPGRLNIVLTRNTKYVAPEGVSVVNSVEEGIALGKKEETGEVFIVGGSQIYKHALENDLIDRAYVTHIDTEVEGDILFPGEYVEGWIKISDEHREKDEKNIYDMNFSVYEKHIVVKGKALAEKVEWKLNEQVSVIEKVPMLAIYVVGEDSATEMYVKKKREFAERIGVKFIEFIFEDSVTESELLNHINELSDEIDGVVVQLPLPAHIDQEIICNAIPVSKDPDLLNQETMEVFENGDLSLLPPVVSAIDEMLSVYSVNIEDKKVLVIGKGKLVGVPAISYFKNKGSQVDAVEKNDGDFKELSLQADIIVSGAGVSDIVTPEMIKEGVILFDGGTSGSSGSLRGDIDWKCQRKATLFSRSPGGIGPLTVASLFKNFITLVEKNI